MAVSKRLRFEILRRDNHACRYCGGIAPDATLTVDHVVPTALGGSDKPDNLVAACKDCNSGKSATPVAAELTTDVAADAFRWAAALQESFNQRVAQLRTESDYAQSFLEAWEGWKSKATDLALPLPDNWEGSVGRWHALGLPIEVLTDAVGKAMRQSNSKSNIHRDDLFRYMAGIVWSIITETQAQAAAMLAAPEPPPHLCEEPWCHVHSDTQMVCPGCNQHDCLWLCGWIDGNNHGRARGAARLKDAAYAIDTFEYLSMACEGHILDEMAEDVDA